MYKKLLLGVVTAFAVVSYGGVVSAEQVVDEPNDAVANLHCPDHNTGTYPKVEVTGNSADEPVMVDGVKVQVVVKGETVNFFDSEGKPIEVVFCVKGGNETTNTGKLTGSTYTHPQDISYVVVYEIPEEPVVPVTPVTPQETDTPEETPVETTQVDAPAEAVNAGGGAVMGSLIALVASVAGLGYGLFRLRGSSV